MKLKEFVSISGKSGLFKIIKPARASVIVESLDDQKKKLVISTNQRISVLDEISIYTNNSEGSTPLVKVFQAIYQEFGKERAIDNDATNSEYLSFLQTVLPEYDRDRVYASDIKKIVRWYYILLREAPYLVRPGSEEEE